MPDPQDDRPRGSGDGRDIGGGGHGTGLAVRTILAVALCVGAGVVATWLHVPLAWILGPMLMAAILSLAGLRFWIPGFGQRVGQVTIGSSIGLNLTGPSLVLLAPLIPVMIVLGVLAMCAGAVASLVLVRFARLDARTAYFAMMPGGLVEMANIGATVGARAEPIALSQAIRMASVVCILPPLVLALGTPGNDFGYANAPDLMIFQIVAVLLAGLVGVVVARVCRLNNYWMIGAMIGAGAVSAIGFVEGRMPVLIVYAGQFLLGVAIGIRFQRDIILRLFRLAVVALLAVLVLTATMILAGLSLAVLSGADFATAVLATAPGGVPEMAVTAQVMHLNVAFVTIFQLVRAFLVNGFAAHLMHLLARIGFFRLGERVSRRD